MTMENQNQEQIEALDNLDKIEKEIEDNNEALEGEVQQEAEQREAEQAQEQAALMGATMAVSFVETLIKAKWDYVNIPPETRGAVIEKAVPVAKKYDAELPPWLAPYKEEIELGMVIAVAGFGVAMQVKARQQQEAEAKAKGGNHGEQESASNGLHPA